MVLPIGFFMPLPLAMMIPFMGIQSAVMAKQFGENFQFGKRRISAMSNEEFNKLTPQTLNENANRELKSMIPSMEKSIIEMRSFQTFLIQEFIKMIQEVGLGVIGQIFGFPDLGEKVLTTPVTVTTEQTGETPATPPPSATSGTYTQDETGKVTFTDTTKIRVLSQKEHRIIYRWAYVFKTIHKTLASRQTDVYRKLVDEQNQYVRTYPALYKTMTTLSSRFTMAQLRTFSESGSYPPLTFLG